MDKGENEGKEVPGPHAGLEWKWWSMRVILMKMMNWIMWTTRGGS